MKKVVGIYELELTGSLIMVKVKGELRGAKEVNPLNDNLAGVDSCHRKLDYFIQRQWDNTISVRG